MELKSFAQDKANHYFYGSLVAAVSAIAAMALLIVWLHWPLERVLPLAALAAGAGALLAGMAKERLDAMANAAAAMLNEPAPHEVSRGDIQATAAGAAPVVAALVALWFIGRW